MHSEKITSDFESSSEISESEELVYSNRPNDVPVSSYIRPATFTYSTPSVQIPRMTATTTNTVLNMPIPKTKLAPETFRGDYSKVKDFIDHYDRLLIQNNVITHKERCETITRYCGRREKETIQNIPSYATPDWTRLREDILRVYDADRDTKRYTMKDVMSFAKRRQRRRIPDLAAWKQYVRSFLRIAGSLLKHQRLTNNEHATYFWKGIPRIMRIRLENRLLAAEPDRNLTTPFSVNEINAAAEALLQRDRFDGAMDSDSDEDSVREEWSTDSETSDSDSEEEEKERRRRRKNKAGRKIKADSSEDEALIKKKKIDSHKRKITSGRSEVEGLIKQLNSMSNEDPGYGLTYYRAVKLDSDVDRVVRAPSFKASINAAPRTYGQQSTYPRVTSYPVPPRPPANTFQAQPSSTFQPQPPPHLSASNAYPMRQPPPGTQRREEIRCYGCGETGHGMSNCQKISEMINQGVLTRDPTGRVVNSDGTGIRRIGNETFVEAVERERRPQSHLVTISNNYFGNDSEEDSELDEPCEVEYEDVYVIQGNCEERYDSYAADKTEKSTFARRREIMDGVYPPPLKRKSERLNKGKENVDVPISIIKSLKPLPKSGQKRPTTNQPVATELPRKEPITEDSRQALAQPARQASRFNPDKDEDILEDKGTNEGGRRQSATKVRPAEGQPVMGEKKPVARQSAVSAHVDPMDVMNQVLNTRVTLAVGEVLGISKELSALVSESIKVKSVKPPLVPVGLATSFRPKTRGLLIKITLECDGQPIEAIIDTGSQLNIVSESIYKSRIRRPIDHSNTVNMNDANGGERTLQGLVKNVPLMCGGVSTEANLYVGEHVPFQLLLGRPWQRGNYVSIDERPDGTYLLFKDPKSLETRYEILVTPDNMTKMDWNFEPSTWHVTDSPVSYLIEVKEEVNHRDKERARLPLADRSGTKKAIPVYLDQGTGTSTIYDQNGQSQYQAIAHKIMSWLGTLLEVDETFPDKYNHTEETIKEERSFKKVPCRFLDTLPEPADMALNIGSVPITSHVEDLPVVYAINAPARSEADDLRDALHHEEYLHSQGHFSNIALNSAQAFVTGYHMDGQGNNYTAITGLRSVRTALAGNGPQTVYGHYTARFYTDLDLSPALVNIPTFHRPTTRTDQNHYFVSRNGDPHAWDIHTESGYGEWIDYQPPARNGNPAELDIEIDRSDYSGLKNVSLPPIESIPPLVPFQPDSRTTASSPTDDENWLPCSRCGTTHGNDVCSSRSNYSLIRISSNGSVSSSVRILDDPVDNQPAVRTNGTIRAVSDEGFGGQNRTSSPVLVYPPEPLPNQTNEDPTHSYTRRPQSSPPQLISHSFIPPSRLGNLRIIRPNLISNEDYHPSDDDSDEAEEMEEGIMSIWREYRKELSKETMESLWGMSPYEIIMDLEEAKLNELADKVIAQEEEETRRGRRFLGNLPTHANSVDVSMCDVSHPNTTLANSLATFAPPEDTGTNNTRDNLPVVSSEQDEYMQHQPEAGLTINHEDNRRILSIPSAYPFTYSTKHLTRPLSYSPASKPEAVAVYTAKFSSSSNEAEAADSDDAMSTGSPIKKQPEQNKFRAFMHSPAVWPTTWPAIYSTTVPDNAHVFHVGAEPISPISNIGEDSEPPALVPVTQGYQELEPVLRHSQERDTPSPITIATRNERARIQQHIESNRMADGIISSGHRTLSQIYAEEGSRRPLPTRPNTPISDPPSRLSGEGLQQALANIEAESNQFSVRVAELKQEPGDSDIQVQRMQLPEIALANKPIKIESRTFRPLPFKASPLRNLIGRWATYETNKFKDQDTDETSSSGSLKQRRKPAPLNCKETSTVSSTNERVIPIEPYPQNIPAPPRRSICAVKPPVLALKEVPKVKKTPEQLRNIPMAERPYHAEFDYYPGAARPRIGHIIALDMRNLHPVTGHENTPVPEAYVRYATVMSGVFEPYIFPDVVHNTPSGPYDLPPIQCTNWGGRVDAMFTCRAAALGVLERVEKALTSAQVTELRRALITMFITDNSGALVEATINRTFFYKTLHPNHNPFLDSAQSTFLRGACYYFRRVQQHVLADAIDVLLRSPQYDDFYCRKLLEAGCLDHRSPFQRQRALDFIKVYEDEQLESEDYSDDWDDKEEMEVGSDYESEHID